MSACNYCDYMERALLSGRATQNEKECYYLHLSVFHFLAVEVEAE